LKFRIDDPAKIVERLKHIGAEKVDSDLESNLKFDRDGKFLKTGELLRLRSYAGKADITYKKKVPSEGFKVWVETIVNIDSFEKGKRLLEAIGFSQIGKYEKKRQTWEFDGVEVLVDVMPIIGNFIEIEGTEEKITETAKKLGFDMKDAITKDYRELFLEHCRNNGIKIRDMVFKEGEK